MCLLLYAGENIHDGDEIGFFNDDKELISAGVFKDGRCGLTVWGEGEREFPAPKLFSKRENKLKNIELTWLEGPEKFIEGKVSILKADGGISSKRLDQTSLTVSALPNPFNNQLTIEYMTAERGYVWISICDIMGRQIEASRVFADAGKIEQVRFDATAWSAGNYIVSLESGSSKARVIVKHLK